MASLELIAGRLLQIEWAVRVTPEAPSVQGLVKMTDHAMDAGGGLATREFTARMATLADQEARVLKHDRLLREELAAKVKDRDNNNDKNKDNNNNNKDEGGAKTGAGGRG